MLRGGHQRQRGLRVPRRRPGDPAGDLPAGRGPRGRDRGPGRLPGPGRVRPPVPRHLAGRPDRRGDLPDRRARRAGPGGRRHGSATSSRTARSTTPASTTRTRPARWSRRCGRTTRTCPCSACAARRCCGSPASAGAPGDRVLRGPQLHRRRPAGRPPRARRHDHRRRVRRPAGGPGGPGGHGRVVLHPRRHSRRGGDGPSRTRRTGGAPGWRSPRSSRAHDPAAAPLRRRRGPARVRRPGRDASALRPVIAQRFDAGQRDRPGRADPAAPAATGRSPPASGSDLLDLPGVDAPARTSRRRSSIPVDYSGADLAEVAELHRTELPTRWSPPTPARSGPSPSAASPPASATWSARTTGCGCPAGTSPRTTGAGRARSGWPTRSPGSTRASGPGGWQLIGRTDASLWDLDRDPPALLQPGRPGPVHAPA